MRVGREETRAGKESIATEVAPTGEAAWFIPNNSLTPELVIPAQAGIQLIKKSPRSGSISGFVRFAGYLFRWIPACAGMTASLRQSITRTLIPGIDKAAAHAG
jgi:hypothetical protein